MTAHSADIAPAFAIIALLDDLDIAGCEHCEELRYQLIDWLQAHSSDRGAKERRARLLFDFLPMTVRKHRTKAEATV